MNDIIDINHIIRSPIVTGIHTLRIRRADKFEKFGKDYDFNAAVDDQNELIFTDEAQIKTKPNFEYIDSFYNLGLFNIETNDTLDELLWIEEIDGKNRSRSKSSSEIDIDSKEEDNDELSYDFVRRSGLQSVTVLVKKNSISVNDCQHILGSNIRSSCVLKGIPIVTAEDTLLENEDSLILSLTDGRLAILKFYHDGQKYVPFIFQWMKYDCQCISAHISGLYFIVYKHNSSFISIFKCYNNDRFCTMVQGLNIFKNSNGNDYDSIIIQCDFIKIKEIFTLFIIYYSKNKISIRSVDWLSDSSTGADETNNSAINKNSIRGDINPISFNNVSLLPMINLKEPPIFIIPINGSHNFIMVFEKFIKTVSSNDIISGIFDIPSIDTNFDSFPLNYYLDDSKNCIYISTAKGNLYCISFLDRKSFESSKKLQVSRLGEFKNIKLSVFQLKKLQNDELYELIYFDESSIGFHGEVKLCENKASSYNNQNNFEIVKTYQTFKNWSPIIDFGVVNESLWLLNNNGYLIQMNYGFRMKTESQFQLIDNDTTNEENLSSIIPFNLINFGNYVIIENVDKHSKINRVCYLLEYSANGYSLQETLVLNVDLQNRSLLIDTLNDKWIIQVTENYVIVSNTHKSFKELFDENDRCYLSSCLNGYIVCVTDTMRLKFFEFQNDELNLLMNVQLKMAVTYLKMFQIEKTNNTTYVLVGFINGYFQILNLEDLQTVKCFQLDDLGTDKLVHNIEILEEKSKDNLELFISDSSGNLYILTMKNNLRFDIIDLQGFQLNEIKIDIIKLNNEDIYLKSLNFYKLVPEKLIENKMITKYMLFKVYNLPKSPSSTIKIIPYKKENFLVLNSKGQFFVTSMDNKSYVDKPKPISKIFSIGNSSAFKMIYLPYYNGILTLSKKREEEELNFFDVKYMKSQSVSFYNYKNDKNFKNVATCISEWTISNEKSKYRNLIIGYSRSSKDNHKDKDGSKMGFLKVFEIKKKSSAQKSNKEIILSCLYSWNVDHPVNCVIQIIGQNCILYGSGKSLFVRDYDISNKKLMDEKVLHVFDHVIMDLFYDYNKKRVLVTTSNNCAILNFNNEDHKMPFINCITDLIVQRIDRCITNGVVYNKTEIEYKYKLEEQKGDDFQELSTLKTSLNNEEIKDYCLLFDKFGNSLVLKDKVHEYSKDLQSIGKLKMNYKNNGKKYDNSNNQKLFGYDYDFIFCGVGGDIMLIRNRT